MGCEVASFLPVGSFAFVFDNRLINRFHFAHFAILREVGNLKATAN
jgi:hypothetical protein